MGNVIVFTVFSICILSLFIYSLFKVKINKIIEEIKGNKVVEEIIDDINEVKYKNNSEHADCETCQWKMQKSCLVQDGYEYKIDEKCVQDSVEKIVDPYNPGKLIPDPDNEGEVMYDPDFPPQYIWVNAKFPNPEYIFPFTCQPENYQKPGYIGPDCFFACKPQADAQCTQDVLDQHIGNINNLNFESHGKVII